MRTHNFHYIHRMGGADGGLTARRWCHQRDGLVPLRLVTPGPPDGCDWRRQCHLKRCDWCSWCHQGGATGAASATREMIVLTAPLRRPPPLFPSSPPSASASAAAYTTRPSTMEVGECHPYLGNMKSSWPSGPLTPTQITSTPTERLRTGLAPLMVRTLNPNDQGSNIILCSLLIPHNPAPTTAPCPCPPRCTSSTRFNPQCPHQESNLGCRGHNVTS